MTEPTTVTTTTTKVPPLSVSPIAAGVGAALGVIVIIAVLVTVIAMIRCKKMKTVPLENSSHELESYDLKTNSVNVTSSEQSELHENTAFVGHIETPMHDTSRQMEDDLDDEMQGDTSLSSSAAYGITNREGEYHRPATLNVHMHFLL